MLFLVISHGIFQLFVFKIFQTKYRGEIIEVIEEGVENNNLTLFRFSKDNFNKGLTRLDWIEENEFRSGNKMYDVVNKEFKGDSVYLYCIHDDNESELYAAMDKIFKRMVEENPDKAKDLRNYNNSLSQFYSKPIETEYSTNLYSDCTYFTKISSDLLEGEYIPVSPPPRS